jgi:DNA-binding SARP family transcriptional activator
MLEIRLLGPLEVRDGERAVEIRRRKQRALLAVLALNAGRVVSRDRLVDQLWGEQAPAGAAHALENYVSQLRKLLGSAVIATRAPGYVLDVDPDEVDALRFERLVRERRLEEALALLRGSPLADVAGEPFAVAEVARLREVELLAREELIELRLEQGRHAEVVPELEQLVVAEPYRERLRGLHMLALYRSGRQADALAAYRSARDALVEGLGIEPGWELQELERAILLQDSSLRMAGPAAPAPQAPPLPPRPARKFVTVVFVLLPEVGQPDPEAIGAARDDVRALAEAALELHGGHVEQSLADCVVAVFGVPTVHEDDARLALSAAEVLADLGARVGLGSGEVFFGGGPVAGEPRSTAERLARTSAPGGIGASETTRQLAEVRGLRLDSPLVGRTRQLAVLSDALAGAVDDGTCQLVTVFGAAGVGKSRLLKEFLVGVERDVVVRRSEEPSEDIPELSGQEPCVLAVEDLHSAEPARLDTIERVAEQSRGLPLLIVCTARTELLDDRPGWGGGRVNARTILLEPLSEDEAEQLMDNLLGESDLPPIVRDYIVGAAEGNPLFLEEFLASLVDRDVLRHEGGTWTTQELPALAVPPSIQALLAARIDRLPDDERQVLELASVEGRRFCEETVTELAPDELRDRLVTLLAALARRDLIREDRNDQGSFSFRHQLLREAAYGSIPKLTRADAHERLAARLGARAGDDHRAQARRLRADVGV